MTIRYSIVLVLFTLLFSVSCGGGTPEEEVPDVTPSPRDTSPESADDDTPVEENPADSTIVATAAEIIALEMKWDDGDRSDEMKQDLVIFHEIYVHSIVQARDVDPAELNEVLYSHYVRILQLEPENAEAEAGLNGVRAWYETHGMTMPSEANPIHFLPGHSPDDLTEEPAE